ncbi:taurine ABC transporter substrate-binding protein [Martelella alba]|uniref:ABC transporter substrate-binding protein n=1 Tax=Martelella alba TaxID=2590451 RepID=A0ABY2SN43_9HYPH|nr:ABC transporter substrate-binding protein [Martelella alba]TKI07184.1 ABC transporter substrate-binding protein [Martelella alba]
MKKLITAVTLMLGVMSAAKIYAASPEQINVGYLGLVNAELVTKHLGLIGKHIPGAQIHYVKLDGGGDMLRAMAGNQVDFGVLGNPPATIGMTRNLPFKGIMVFDVLNTIEGMAVRDSANIHSIHDLIGKRVAAPFGTTTHYLLLQALKQAGIKPSQLTILDLSPTDIVAAWGRGDIDAAWFWEPGLNKVVQNGGKILMYSGEMAKKGYPTWDIGLVMNDFAKKYPDDVRKFVAAECEGIDYWLKNPDDTAKIIAEELSISLPDATRMMKGVKVVPCAEQTGQDYLGHTGRKGRFVDTLESTAQFLVSQQRLPAVLPRAQFAAYLDPSWLEKQSSH